jgi:putative transposase
MVSVAARRSGVAFAEGRGLSQRRATTLMRTARSSLKYRARKAAADAAVIGRMKELAAKYPRFGYRRIQVYLERDGFKLNAKRMHRLWRQAKLQLPKKRPRKRVRGTVRDVPETPVSSNQVWSYDFVFDHAANGQQIKCLTVVDEGTSEGLAIDVAGSIRATRVIEVLSRLVSERGPPKVLRSDNGPEFVSRALLKWVADAGIESALIEPGKPWQNGTCESFNGKFRDECLSVEWFRSREEARVLIEQWRRHYNEDRPHQGLGNLTPATYARKLAAGEIAPRKQRRSVRPATGRSAACVGHSAARPVAPSETAVQGA